MNDAQSEAQSKPPGRYTRHLASIPRWVKVFVVVAATLLLLVVVAMLIAGGQHGPSRHQSAPSISESAAASPHAIDAGLGDVC